MQRKLVNTIALTVVEHPEALAALAVVLAVYHGDPMGQSTPSRYLGSETALANTE